MDIFLSEAFSTVFSFGYCLFELNDANNVAAIWNFVVLLLILFQMC